MTRDSRGRLSEPPIGRQSCRTATGLQVRAPVVRAILRSSTPPLNPKRGSSCETACRPDDDRVALVLLVACTNIANLVLARGSARRHENAVRLALGASRWRLIREQLAEAVLVTFAGGVAALLIAQVVMVKLLSASFDLAPGISIQVAPGLNAPVAAIAAAGTIVCLVIFGLIPAVHNTRANLRDALASDGQAPPLQRWRGRRNLIAVQVAVSGGLVAVAVLCAQQAIESSRHDPGFDLDRIAFARVDFGMQKKHRLGRQSTVRAAWVQPTFARAHGVNASRGACTEPDRISGDRIFYRETGEAEPTAADDIRPAP